MFRYRAELPAVLLLVAPTTPQLWQPSLLLLVLCLLFPPAADMESSAAARQACSAGSTLELRDTVLINILKRLPQRDRLMSAARVCKPWQTAATAATTDVVLVQKSASRVESMGSWVSQRGEAAVEAIIVREPLTNRAYLKLPCVGLTQLITLHLDSGFVRFVSTSDPEDPAVVVPALRSFTLTNSCTMYMDTPPALECPKLTELIWEDPSCYSTPAGSKEQLDTVLLSFLQQLPELGVLSLKHETITDAALAQLSCLQQLQRCTLCCPHVTAAVLANLSSSLTSLTLTRGRGILQEGSLPAAGWPCLKELSMTQRVMRPALLSRLTALERLSLKSCKLLPQWVPLPQLDRQAFSQLDNQALFKLLEENRVSGCLVGL